MTKDFSITLEDYNNSGKEYTKPQDCPATIAIKRQLGVDATLINWDVVAPDWIRDVKSAIIGSIALPWGPKEFDELAQGKEFNTEITLYEGEGASKQ